MQRRFILAPQWRALLASAALLLLTLPAAAMGAGFPLLVEAWRRAGREIGTAYGSNTLGAAAGALLPLLLLPSLGWSQATRAVALLSLIAAAGFWIIDRRAAATDAAPASPAIAVPATASSRPRPIVLLCYGVIGAASLLLEMAWIRLFSLVMLRTEYVLALILAVMLLGMGLGSLIASRRQAQRLIAVLPWCASLSAIAGLYALPAVSGWLEKSDFHSLTTALIGQGALLAALTLPVTLSLGAWLPALSERFRLDGSRLYAANALGAVLGALAYVAAVAVIGSAGVVALAAVLLLLPGLALLQARRAWACVPLVLAAAWGASALPPVAALLPRAMAGSRDLYRYEDAIAITQVVEQSDGQRVLLTDLRRRDASTEPTAVFVQANQARLPLLLHADPHRVLFIGIGTGISVAGSLPFPDLRRSAVELSAGSIEAAGRWFTADNLGIMQQTRVTQDDARHFLSASADLYDVIVGDLFHPDLAGVSSLLSVEQFQRVKARLAQNGLYVQWLALNQFDQETLGVVLRSFHEVFPESQLFLDGLHLALVGPRDHWQGAAALEQRLERMSGDERAHIEAPEPAIEWLGRYWGPIDPGAGALQHEWAPVIEFLLPRLHYAGADLAPLMRSLLARRPTIDAASRQLRVASAQHENFRRAYIGTELRVRSELANWQGSALEADRLLGLAYDADPHDRWVEYALADRLLANLDAAAQRGIGREELLQKIVIINPWSVDAWKALRRLQIANHDAAAASSRARILELSPLDRDDARIEK
jgi:spermidine synthase